DLGVFITCDDGATWMEYNDNLPVSIILDIEFNPADTTLRIGTLGRGAWVTKSWMPGEPSAVDSSPHRSSFGITSVAPNPASEAVRIDYFLEKKAAVHLDVLNALGQKVADIFSAEQAGGAYSNSWNGQTINGLRTQT